VPVAKLTKAASLASKNKTMTAVHDEDKQEARDDLLTYMLAHL
jgi:hypothetical protein